MSDDHKAFPAPAFDEPPRRLRIYLVIWYAATVLAFVSVVVWAVMISTQPAEANPRVEPLRYTTNWPPAPPLDELDALLNEGIATDEDTRLQARNAALREAAEIAFGADDCYLARNAILALL